MKKASMIHFLTALLIILISSLTAHIPRADATMQNYCLIPPYVMRGGVPPNLVIAYEKGSAILNRAYGTTYDATTTYYGFFDSAATYRYCNPTSGASPCASSDNFFEKASCTPSSAAATNCFSGNALNWALMSSLDLSRKAIIGFGEPNTGAGTSAGELFSYSGALYSRSQTNGAIISAVGYTFCLDAATGSNPTGLKIRLGEGQANCNSATLVIGATGGGNFRDVSMRFTDEYRLGLIQRIGDANQDLRFDVAGPRFAVRRWNNGTDKQADIMNDSPALTTTQQESYFKALLTAISKAPPDDPAAPQLSDMMIDISRYFRGLSSTYSDNDAYSQTPYSWVNDPLRACRKSFVLYITTGVNFGSTTESPLPAACSSLTYPNEAPYTTAGIAGTAVTDPFARNTCAAFNTDHYTADGTPPRQNVSSFVVHTTFYGGAATALTKAKLQYAANVSDGLYYDVDNPSELLAALERAVLEMLRRAASGTAASVLASGQGEGANLVQVVFYPETPRTPLGMFDRRASWVGRLSNYWYYVDPFYQTSTILDDSGTSPVDKILDLSNDKKVSFRFSHADDATVADRYNFGSTTLINSIRFERTVNLWDAGVELWKRDISVASNKRKIYTTINGTSFLSGNFSQDTNNGDSDNAATLQPYLNLTTLPNDDLNSDTTININDTRVLIRYLHGEDFPAYNIRPRTVAVDLNGDGNTSGTGEGEKVWKLGDVLNSTPRISSWVPLNTYHEKYSDITYGNSSSSGFINSATYTSRGMVFAGGNDGMLHAFKLGTLELTGAWKDTDQKKARLTGADLGKEIWAFIPKNALPYLKHLTRTDYCHVYTVDLSPYIFDASISRDAGVSQPGECTDTNYWNCNKTANSWRTILIGGMRYGGACKDATVTCSSANSDDLNGDGVINNNDCARTPVAGNGYSSYFALDVTDQNNPQLLWEFSNANLGFTTTGPSIVKINGRTVSGTVSAADTNKNGRWFVVFGSGPTGPGSRSPEYQFYGNSDQNLRLFILDVKTGQLLRTITMDGTGGLPSIPGAHAGSMINNNVDTDLDYQDDVLYIPYVRKCTATANAFGVAGSCPGNSWTNGGILRVVTREDLDGTTLTASGNTALNPANWTASIVMDNIGPVTSSVANLQNQRRGELWLYFGTGRYYFELGNNTDDATGQRHIFGIKDPCFTYAGGYNTSCTTSRSPGDLVNVTNIADVPSDPAVSGYNGWYIALDPSGTYTYCEGGNGRCNPPDITGTGTLLTRQSRSERMITDPLATTTGVAFFTTYKPYNDICAYGGKSAIWAVKYDTGGAPGALLKGLALVQVSTGAIEQINLSTAFDQAGGRKTSAMEGVPPTQQGLSVMSTPPPVKRVIHMKER